MVAATSGLAALAQDTTQKGTQVIRGTVLDAVSNSSVTGATVTVIENGKTIKGAIVKKNGTFRIAGVPLGRKIVKITMIGYEPYINDNVLVTAGKEVVMSVTLNESYSTSKEIEVVYDRSADEAVTNSEYTSVSARAFNTEDTKRYAGSLGDPSRMAQNFAGVVGANDSRNDIVVRGNSPAGMLWQMDGMIIPNPNHFGSLNSTGGPVSMLNNNVLDKSDFMTSAFPSPYGNALSGVFDLRMRNGNPEKYEFVGQIGFNGFEFGAEGPAWEGSTFLANYRYSTLGVFKGLGINFGTGSAVPDYQDANVKLSTKLGEAGTLTLFGTGGKSDVAFYGNDVDTTAVDLYGDPDRNTEVDYQTGWLGLSYEHILNENTFAKILVGASGTFEQYKGDSINPQTREAYHDEEAELTTTRYSVAGNIRHKFTNRTSITGGFFVDRTKYDLYRIENIGLSNELVNIDIEDDATLSQGYAQLRTRLTEEFTVNAGLHAQYYTLGDAVAVEPRAGIVWSVSPTMSLNAGYGLHSQAQNIYVYNVQEPDSSGALVRSNLDLGFTRSHHAVLGYDWFISNDIRLRIETYYQWLFDVPVERTPSSFSAINTGAGFAPSNQGNLINTGTGHNVGLELTLEHFFRNGFYFLVTGSFFDSRYLGSDGIERNTAYNTRYVANFLGGKEFSVGDNNVIAVNLKVSTTGGRYLTPIDLEASAAAGRTVYDESQAYTQLQDPYFRMDLRLSYRMELGSSTMEFALDLQNVTNNQNVFTQTYNPRTGGITTEYQQGFFPVPTFRWTF
ncbi:MAG: TonB-dependent receptor [Ignavibacteria bacterium]|nr:TonB-dependent receptor [Ignavibacteria bacterium]MBK7186253.1 TonB-dependent receptor [Ignavibacteria bacterium]MBK7578209.1 TonB-dependent receptor [Ignavibacteria bacterium]MBK9183971.1 TonB-dependent receptor [Ignavibacteria bacterium]